MTAVALSHDGRTLVAGSWDKTVEIWDSKNYVLQATFFADVGVKAVDLANTARILACDNRGQIHCLRLRLPNH